MSNKLEKFFGDRKRFTADSFKNGRLADLPDEIKESLIHGGEDPEEFFAGCDDKDIDCSHEHTLFDEVSSDE